MSQLDLLVIVIGFTAVALVVRFATIAVVIAVRIASLFVSIPFIVAIGYPALPTLWGAIDNARLSFIFQIFFFSLQFSGFSC